MEKLFCVYILASGRHGTLYIGVTSDLLKRVWEHKSKVAEGFTSRYSIDFLVYFEVHENAESAIRREKRLKFWRREWKIALIEKDNPRWRDLYGEIGGDAETGKLSLSSSCALSAGSTEQRMKATHNEENSDILSYGAMDPAVKPQDDEARLMEGIE